MPTEMRVDVQSDRYQVNVLDLPRKYGNTNTGIRPFAAAEVKDYFGAGKSFGHRT